MLRFQLFINFIEVLRYCYIALAIFLLACSNEHTIDKKEHFATWTNGIANIIFTNCTPCHRPNQSGPFNLLSYNDAVKKAKLIKFVTETGYMPPWPADESYTHFVGERVLADSIKNMIKQWVEQGCKYGDSSLKPQPPAFNNFSFYRKPDLVIKAQQPVSIKGNGTDAFYILKFPYEIPHDTIVDFVEFVPHQRKLVHHVNGHLVSYDSKRKFNYQSGVNFNVDVTKNLMSVYSDMHIPYTDGLQPNFPMLTPNVVYYLPGYLPPNYPDDIGGYPLKKNGLFLLNNIHYGPSANDCMDSSYLNVFFRKNPIKRGVRETQLGTFGISEIVPEFFIEPGKVKTFVTQTTLSQDISVLSVNPHMHLIGKSFWAFAFLGTDTIPLIRIRKWDFRWQYYYTFLHPVKIPKGYTIKVIGEFDNTDQNPNNPFHPPRLITNGNGVESMKTTEEMFQFIFTYMPYKSGDENINLNRP